MTSSNNHQPILFFDGVCNLCNSSVQFILKHDKKKQFLFAPLQSARGAEALRQVDGKPDSLILFYNNRYLIRSDAALYTARLLGLPISLIFAGIILPRFFRDWVYNFIARNRYRWFGKKDECMLPTPELRARFLS